VDGGPALAGPPSSWARFERARVGTKAVVRFALTFLVFAALLPVGAVASSNTARIGFTSISPVSVRATGFKPGERVALTVSAKVTRKKTTTASMRGAFRATFSGFSIVRCQAYAVVAKGNRGSVASAKVIPECAPPPPTPSSSDSLQPRDPNPKKP